MRNVYKYLAYAIPVLVAVQAAAIALAAFGLFSYMDEHTITKGTQPDTPGGIGFMIHGMNGQFLIPLVAIVLLIVSFFAKVPGGAKWAAFILLDVVVQVLLAFVSFGAPQLGFLHGLNALILFALGVYAARRVDTALATGPAAAPIQAAGEGARA
ncbi:MAG TPA: hypothetical protein VFJ19_14430 [Nocardioidaceae bacterium]|nr:hypothetical protein [Nocardioidaceae bacterium]